MKLSGLGKKQNYMTRFKNIANYILNHEELLKNSSLLPQLTSKMTEHMLKIM